MAVIDSRIKDNRWRVAGTQRGKRKRRWPDRIDQKYLAKIVDEGRLTERDIALLQWITDVRCATADQIARVFFINQGTARNRLSTLYGMRMVERAYFPHRDSELLDVSFAMIVYYLGRGGKYWLQEIEHRQFNRSWHVHPPDRVAHDLMSTELVVAIQEDVRRFDQETGKLVRTQLASEQVVYQRDGAGQVVTQEYKKPGKTQKKSVVLLRSDMRVELQVGNGEGAKPILSLLIEADKGTETRGELKKKIKEYNQYVKQWYQKEVRKSEDNPGYNLQKFPIVLFVTTGKLRAKNLAELISKESVERILWCIVDWKTLKDVDKILTDPVWTKAVIGKVANNQSLAPGLRK